jgi:hypothetical protein
MSVIIDGTNGISDVDGSASTPAIRGTDANTGIFFPAADTIAFSEGGTEVARFDSSGNLGIGTSSPGAKLDVLKGSTITTGFDDPQIRAINSGTATANQRVDIAMRWQDGTYNGTGGISMVRESSTARSGALTFSSIPSDGNGTERMRITSGGDVIVGATSATTGDRIVQTKTYDGDNGYSGNRTAIVIADDTVRGSFQAHTGGSQVIFGTETAHAVNFITNNSERMRIDSSGIAFINGTTNQDSNAKLQVFSASGNSNQGYIGSYTGGSGGGRANQNVGFHVGQTNLRIYADWDGSGNPRNKINVQAVSAGVELTSGSTSWASLSDERKKDIIEPITDALNKVSGLRTVIGKYKNEEDRRRVFLIAQDVQAVLPEAVDESTDEEKTLGLRYTDIIPLLVASIKELNTKVEAQAAEIAALKNPPQPVTE